VAVDDSSPQTQRLGRDRAGRAEPPAGEQRSAWLSSPRGLARLRAGGEVGNERLTGLTGAVLLALLLVEGVTILFKRQLLSVHMFVGVALIGPVALKMGSTGYRFVRYYAGSVPYRLKGPPPMLRRAIIAPVVVVSTIVVLASGVALMFVGPSSRHSLLPIHQVSFFVWLAFTSAHVLAHLPSIPAVLRAEHGPAPRQAPGRGARRLALVLTLAAGVLVAVLVIPQFPPWLNLHHLGERH
jgi:hypothetical protein